MAANATITGSVVDPQGRPIAHARAFFTAAPVALPDIAAQADSNGHFALTAPQRGEYTVGVVADGFAPSSTRVTATPAHDTTIRVVLEPEQANQT